jgi:hypothetical protein
VFFVAVKAGVVAFVDVFADVDVAELFVEVVVAGGINGRVERPMRGGVRCVDERHRLRADALIVVGGVDEDHVEMNMIVAFAVEDDAADAGVIYENGVALVLRDLLPHPFNRVVAGRTAEFDVGVDDGVVVEGGDLRGNERGCVVGRGGADDGGHRYRLLCI